MTKRMIEVNDVLPDRVAGAIEEVERELRDYITENKPDEVPCISNDLDYSGAIHDIINSRVPVYDSEIDAAWFLHGRDLEEAYENAGIGDNTRDRGGVVAIYCYIEQKVNEWYHDNAERIFEEMTK